MKILICALLLLTAGCSSAKKASTAPQEKTDYCLYADEVCGEAESFQKEFDARTEEEKKELIPVMNSYIEHCQSARKDCSKSMR